MNAGRKEVVILEKAKQGQIHADGQEHPPPRGAAVGAGVNGKAGEEAHQAGEQQQEADPPVPPAVEDIAGGAEKEIPLAFPLEAPEQEVHDGEEREEKNVGVKYIPHALPDQLDRVIQVVMGPVIPCLRSTAEAGLIGVIRKPDTKARFERTIILEGHGVMRSEEHTSELQSPMY